MKLDKLKKVLLASIKKNGDKPLTLQHLVNIISLIQKDNDKDDDVDHYEFYADINS